MMIIFIIIIMIVMMINREPPAALRRHAMKTVQDYLATAPHLFQVIVIVMIVMRMMMKMATMIDDVIGVAGSGDGAVQEGHLMH